MVIMRQMLEYGSEFLKNMGFFQPVAFALVKAHNEIADDLGNPEGYLLWQEAVRKDISKCFRGSHEVAA